MAIDAASRRFVRKRAGGRCEYCGLMQDQCPFVSFHIEHIVARQHGSSDDLDNLCQACHWCNFHKGPNVATLFDGELVRLFNPRHDVWSQHFSRDGNRIVGLTPIGWGTVRLLNMNDDERCEIRSSRL